MADARRPTLVDVARHARVSRSTVSYAYNQPGRLSPALRARVLAAAAALDYPGPNPTAASLRRGRVGALGVLFSEALSYAFADPAAVLFLQGVASVGERANVALTLLPVPPESEGALAAVRGSLIDGVIVYSLPEEHPAVAAAAARRLPLVRVDMPAAAGTAAVRIDDRAGARATAAHLLALGHRHVGVLADRLSADAVRGAADPARRSAATFPVARWRLAGIADALAAAGLDLDLLPVEECGGNTVADGCAGARRLLAAEPRITALACLTDQLARGAVRAARELGRRVPAGLSVTGFDDLPGTEEDEPPLTTVHQDHVEKGVRAGRLLIEPPPNGTADVVLGVRLVVRGSTAHLR